MNIIQAIKRIPSRLHFSIKSGRDEVLIDFIDFEITKREVILSVAIIAFMMILGFGISEKISEKIADEKKIYNQALQIDDIEMFKYGMATDVGNAFVYGELAAVDSVSFDEISGEYLWVERVEEEYTRHERQVRHEDSKGNVYYTTEEYWTWDALDWEEKRCKNITFLGVKFDYDKIAKPYDHYIDTFYIGNRRRNCYYGIDAKLTGTIFTELKDNTISDNSHFYQDLKIAEVLESKNKSYSLVIF